ncbi:DUF6288 domain-containing protein [Haloferula sp. A504]|uniref:DUF6288 domain-containing protein n=1 Tax=Haloferula sp. A504 TaxID=3373601 RepID=UPI0031C10E5D|nr:DUF6288 domain-containing protein [Verrucomicrobiaceae bacterium E54]
MNINPARATTLATLFFLTLSTSLPAARGAKLSNPDFTKGDAIPEGADHDWNLGATGMRGWMYSERLTTLKARQIRVTRVTKGTPADGVMKVGDVILGVGGEPFSHDPRTEFGKALTRAETEEGAGKFVVTRWRDGETAEVTIQLPVLGTYSATAPYDCEKSEKILEQGLEALAAEMADPSYRGNPITRSLNALALLASGEEKYLPLVKREAEWGAGYSTESMATWWYGHLAVMLAEYVMVTGDQSVMPGLRRIAVEAAKGQSIVGSWGHKFAGDDGRLVGYGMMNSPGAVLTNGLVLAREAGVDDPEVAEAIERSAKLLRFYVGKGAVPYGDHAPWMQMHEDNGKCGMSAVLFDLLDEKDNAEFFGRMSIASHGNERDTGHTGNFFNVLWAMPSIARSGPHATGQWMKEFGAWYYDLARTAEGTFPHQGPPSAGPDKYKGWDASGTYLLAYAMPRKVLRITGRGRVATPQLDAEQAAELVADGRGWDNLNRIASYLELNSEVLFERLGSWSPVIRDRAAMALAKKEDVSIEALVRMLESGTLEERLGACQTLAKLGARGGDAVPALRKTLGHEHMWLRVQAAEALAGIGEPAMEAVPQLLEMVLVGPTDADPRGMEQRFLCSIVFGSILKKSIDGVDRELLGKAVVAGLKNEDGRARGTVGGVYDKLAYEELEPLLPAIRDAIVNPSPSGIMFADGIRLAGLRLFAKHRIAEGIPLCFAFLDLERWNKRSRISQCLDALEMYGPAAKPMIPQLKQLRDGLSKHREAKGLQPITDRVEEMITQLEGATGSVELRHLK